MAANQPALRVLEVFDSLQGEGFWAGVPMTFVRLAGCNAAERGLACVRWCDTPGSWDPDAGEELRVSTLLTRPFLPRVCLTGGEPLLQGAGLAALVSGLRERGHRVHVESNGSLDLPLGTRPDWLTVSPKPPQYEVSSGLLDQVREIKIIVDAESSRMFEERLESLAARLPAAIVCLQPEASAGQDAIREAIGLVMRHPEWRLSLQLHKLLGVR